MAIGSFKTIRSNALYSAMAACAVIFAAQAAVALAGAGDARMAALVLHSQASELTSLPWTPFSYALVHRDFMHLLLNMLWLYAFGRIMLGYATQRRFACTMAGGALSGAACFLAYCALRPDSAPASLMGASAAILAVATAAAVDVPNLPLRLWPLGEVRLKWVVGAIVLVFCIGLTGSAGSTAAHAGGAAFGIGSGIMCRRRAAAVKAVASKTDMHRELDRLLDKVRASGYESLSSRDRRRIFDLSRRVKQ